jgi:isopenicillin-N epimerase
MSLTEMTKPGTREADWEAIKSLFNLSPEYIHLGTSQYIASHPTPVREAIDQHRHELDSNPVLYIVSHEQEFAHKARAAAAEYLGMDDPEQIALTDSTTMGLGTIYTGLNIQNGQEILTNEHNYFAQQEAIKEAARRTGATFREVHYYDNIDEVTEEELVGNVIKEVTDKTRVVGATWVHSNTGLKSPDRQISAGVSED